MKYVKSILLLIAVVAVGALLWNFVFRNKADDGITLEEGTKAEKTINENINNLISNAPNDRFCKSDYERILKEIDLFFDKKPSTKQTYVLRLNNEYTQKFISQANYVFSNSTWKTSDLELIRNEVSRLYGIMPDEVELEKIKTVLSHYDNLKSFNARVASACHQSPKCLEDATYIYKSDDWNVQLSRELMNSIPNFSGLVQNSPVYRETRSSRVTDRLENAHRAFIKDKLSRSEQEFESFNYNPARHTDWECIARILRADFKTYYDLWSVQTTEWQERVNRGEKYAMSKEL